jgi:hypothetical protein
MGALISRAGPIWKAIKPAASASHAIKIAGYTELMSMSAAFAICAIDFGPMTLPVPALVLALCMGRLAMDCESALPRAHPRASLVARYAIASILAINLWYSGQQLHGAIAYMKARSAADVSAAAEISPGDYQLQLSAGVTLQHSGNCGRASTFLRRALSLFPNNIAPREALQHC